MAKSRFLVLFVIILSAGLFECSLNPYKTLSVSKSASQKEIKRAYKKLAREWYVFLCYTVVPHARFCVVNGDGDFRDYLETCRWKRNAKFEEIVKGGLC